VVYLGAIVLFAGLYLSGGRYGTNLANDLTWRKALHLRHATPPKNVASLPWRFVTATLTGAGCSAHTMSTVGYGNIYPVDEYCTCVMVLQVRWGVS
jgi:hypothetical protein